MNKSTLEKVFQNSVVILECHNEQKRHVASFFRHLGVNSVRYPMHTADYSFMVMPDTNLKNKEPLFFGDKFLIERKSGPVKNGGGFSELRSNLFKGHKQFKAEFQRMEKVKDVFLLIENAKDYNCIKKVPPQQLSTERFMQTYDSFIKNRNKDREKDIQIVYTSLEDSGKTVMNLIFSYLLEEFKDK